MLAVIMPSCYDRRMLIQYLSDLHLEGLQGQTAITQVRPAEGVDVLVLAGDIVQLRRLDELRHLTAPFTEQGVPVLYVPGNHEYYRLRVPIPDRVLTVLDDIPGLHLLDNQAITIDGVRFLGSTLWSPLKAIEPGIGIADDEELRTWLNDFKCIRYDDGTLPMTPARMRTLHQQAWDWLSGELKHQHDGPTVVITHFVPTPAGIAAEYTGDYLNGYFACDCRSLMNSNIELWICGHTHSPFQVVDEESGTTIVCNPFGYRKRGKPENPLFNPTATYVVNAPSHP